MLTNTEAVCKYAQRSPFEKGFRFQYSKQEGL